MAGGVRELCDGAFAHVGRGATVTPEDGSRILALGKRVLRQEREALQGVEERLGSEFAKAVEIIMQSSGRVIVAGMGKSGLIGRKIAATLTSTGTPATFLHP